MRLAVDVFVDALNQAKKVSFQFEFVESFHHE